MSICGWRLLTAAVLCGGVVKPGTPGLVPHYAFAPEYLDPGPSWSGSSYGPTPYQSPYPLFPITLAAHYPVPLPTRALPCALYPACAPPTCARPMTDWKSRPSHITTEFITHPHITHPRVTLRNLPTHLRTRLTPDDRLEVAHHHGVRVGPRGRAQDVVRRLHVGHLQHVSHVCDRCVR